MPDLAVWQTLAAVEDTGSFNAAAQRLGVSQQAVSARMRSLEEQVGAALLVRSASGTRLTDTGVVVAEWAHRLLAVAEEIDAGLAGMAQQHQELRLAASLTIAEHLVPRWLVSFTGTAAAGPAPRVSFTATNSEHACALLRAGEVDLGFVEGPEVAAGVQSRVVAHDRLLLVVPPQHRWARRRSPVSPSELAATALVTREQGSGTRQILEHRLRRALPGGLDLPEPLLELSTTAAVISAVSAGAGPAVLSDLSVSADIGRRLVAVEVSELDLRRELRAVWLGERPAARPAQDFLDHLLTLPRR